MSDINVLKGHHRARRGDLELQVDIGQVNDDLAGHLLGVENKVEKAVGRAIKKTGRWLRTHSAREMGKALGIKQTPLKRRFRFTDTGRGFGRQSSIWVGLLAIAAHHAGKTTQNSAGVSMRGRQFDSAFKQRIYGSEEKVYIRANANRKLRHATVGGRESWKYRRKSASFLAEYGDRFPVQVVGIEIEEIGREVLERYEKRLNGRYREILEQELEYALYHEN